MARTLDPPIRGQKLEWSGPIRGLQSTSNSSAPMDPPPSRSKKEKISRYSRSVSADSCSIAFTVPRIKYLGNILTLRLVTGRADPLHLFRLIKISIQNVSEIELDSPSSIHIYLFAEHILVKIIIVLRHCPRTDLAAGCFLHQIFESSHQCQLPRVELSHWSRSVQILSSHWSRSVQILSSDWLKPIYVGTKVSAKKASQGSRQKGKFRCVVGMIKVANAGRHHNKTTAL